MRNSAKSFTVRASVLAVQGAIVTMVTLAMLPAAAYAEESIAELTKPTNNVEVGLANVDNKSAKFGEYNGMEKKGAYLLGGFNVYGGGGDDSAMRFHITGADLGLDTRSLSAEFGEQGKFRFNFGYDEIVKNGSDSFKTPYNGAGTGTLTLPANWETNRRNCGVSSTSTGNTNFGGVSNASTGTYGCGNYQINQNVAAGNLTATPVGNALAMTGAELGDFHNVDLTTQRKKGNFGVGLVINKQWQVNVSASHETKQGVQALGQPYTGTSVGQQTIPNPIDYTTNEFNLNLSFKGDKSFAQATYAASIFKDNISSVMVQNPYLSSAVPLISATGAISYPYPDWYRTSTMPSNQYHQLGLSGGYDFSKTIKLVGGLSYGRSTQDEAFMPAGTGVQEAVALPDSSLHGKVINQAANLKLTAKPMTGLVLSAAYKYDKRDNQTTSRNYRWAWNDAQTTASNTMWSIPYSKKVNQWNLDANYNFMRGQAIKVGYENQKVDRWCNSYGVNTVPATAGALCVNAANQKEDTARVEYRNTMIEDLTGRIAYAVSDRTTSQYGYIGQYQNDPLTKFIFADRKRDKLRSSVAWQATGQLELTAGYDLTKDDFTLGKNPNGYLPLGLDSSKSAAINLEAAFRLTETLSFIAFYTREDMTSVLNGDASNNTGAATATSVGNQSGLSRWKADMKDKTDTYGLGFKALKLAGKWDLNGDYVRSRSTSPYAAVASGGLNAYAATPLGTTNNNTVNILNQITPGTSLSGIYSNTDEVKLSGLYALDKHSAVRIGYVWQKLSSADPARYTSLQPGAASSFVAGSAAGAVVNTNTIGVTQVQPVSVLLPTYEQAPNYKVQVISVSYIYSFK